MTCGVVIVHLGWVSQSYLILVHKEAAINDVLCRSNEESHWDVRFSR